MVPEVGLPHYRQLVYGAHRVVYRLDSDGVAILTVRSFKQNVPGLELE